MDERIKRGSKEGWERVRREMRKEVEGLKKEMKMELEKRKENWKRKEEGWNKERKEIKERIEKMEQEIEGLKVGIIRDGEGKGRVKTRKVEEDGKEKEEEGDWRESVRKLERGNERRERGERKRNILMKGIKEGKGGLRVEVERVLKKIEGEVGIEEIRRIEGGSKKGSMVIVKVKREEEKRNIMNNKWRLRGEQNLVRG